MAPFLSGIRVLDLSLQLPGPFCTLMMADHGATVIKVDEPVPRVRNPFSDPSAGISPADRYLNRGKKSLTLNLKSDAGREIFLALAKTSDVVIEGFRPGVVDRLGIGPAAVTAVNPRIIYCSISGYGQTGPLAKAAGHDINYVSYAGVLGQNGTRDGMPVPPPIQVGDLFGGAMVALSSILMALIARGTTGKGARLDISMTDGAMAMMSLHAADVLTGVPEPALGDMLLTGRLPCYGVHRCKDGGFLSIGPLEGWFWEKMVKAMGRDDLVSGQYATGVEGDLVRAELAMEFMKKTRDEWVTFLAPHDVCASPVLSMTEAYAHPNTVARGMILPVGTPDGPTEPQLASPVMADGERPSPERAARLGEHDDEILGELGYDRGAIERLRAEGVIRK